MNLRRDAIGNVITQEFIDQPIFRKFLGHQSGEWFHAHVDADQLYIPSQSPHDLNADYAAAVHQERGKSAFALSMLSPDAPRNPRSGDGNQPHSTEDQIAAEYPVELFAGAPDWLFGRSCLKHVGDVLPILRGMGPVLQMDNNTKQGLGAQCDVARTEDDPPRKLNVPAPGPVGRALVAVHFVYR